jgi:4-hydroxythreonine-4-phosphate dehydrogenase
MTPAPLVVAPGEPGGVGTEITLKAWTALKDQPSKAFALISDFDFVESIGTRIASNVPIARIGNIKEALTLFSTALPVLHRPLPSKVEVGSFTPATANWVTSAISDAVDMCLANQASGMVTNPIQKEALYAAGFKHQGHTDFLAALCHDRGLPAEEVMMLVGGGLRAVPVTVHIALKDVPSSLTQQAIAAQAKTVDAALRRHFGISKPRIAISGLNPHAGENGSMGHEEINVIRPAIAQLQSEGIQAFGPLPADTAFFPSARDSYDVILCMYHDQALIPVKTLDFHGGVNVTLGLPFIRTSPDHGTALNIAGTGKAQAESLVSAIHLAAKMAAA